MRDAVSLLSFADHELASGSEEYCAVTTILRLERIGDDTGFRKDMEAEIVVIHPEFFNRFVFFRVEFDWWGNVSVLEYFARLVVVALLVIIDKDPANAEAHVGSYEGNGLVDPPDNPYYIVLILPHNLRIGLHLLVHVREGVRCGHARQTDQATAPGIDLATAFVEVSEVKLHCQGHG